jgi:hypothetical protein
MGKSRVIFNTSRKAKTAKGLSEEKAPRSPRSQRSNFFSSPADREIFIISYAIKNLTKLPVLFFSNPFQNLIGRQHATDGGLHQPPRNSCPITD